MSASNSKRAVGQKDSELTDSFVETLIQRQRWGLRALEDVRDNLRLLSQPSSVDLLRARAFALAHAMFDDAAIACFNVLVAQKKARTTRDVLKFAQLLLRRGKPEDIERCHKLTSEVLKKAEPGSDDRWFALHIATGAFLAGGDYRRAAETGRGALDERGDRRTDALVRLAEAFERGGDVPLEFQQSAIGKILSLDPNGGDTPTFALQVGVRCEPMA